jgi:hypothetical protein
MRVGATRLVATALGAAGASDLYDAFAAVSTL